jgi:hypothetical protein
MAKKRTPAGRKATGNQDIETRPLRRGSWITGRIRTDVRPERALTWPGGPVRSEVGQALAPKDKLDTMITTVTGAAVCAVGAAGSA